MTVAEMEFGSNVAMVLALFGLAAVFYLVEICTPTFGIMAIAAVAADIAAVYFSYQIGTTFGTVALISCIVGTAVYLFVLVKFLPKTPLGKLLVHTRNRDATNEATPEAGELSLLIGMTGEALTDLRPVGKVVVDDRTIDARAERTMIAKGDKVEVISAGGTDIVVRLTEPGNNDKDQVADAAGTE